MLLPLIVIDGTDDIESPTDGKLYNSRDVARFGYTLLVMAIYWIFECVPLAVTALLPYVFYPLFGIRNASDVAKNYMKNTNLLLLGGLMVAISIEVGLPLLLLYDISRVSHFILPKMLLIP